MQDALEITSRFAASGVRVFTVSGRLDSRGTPRFVREFTPAPSGGECVVVNLSGVRFLSSSGIGALLALSEQARENGGELRLAEPAPVVTATIDLLNLREYLNLYDSEEEALKRAA
jgi:anti-sigma B factor antagonist